MMKHRTILGWAGALLALGAGTALAFTEAAGRVTRVIGAAEVLRDGQHLPLAKDDVVRSGDTLRTPVDGRLQWWMEDDALLVIATRSQAQVRSFDPAVSEALFQIERGGLRVIAGAVRPKVLTPRATVTSADADFSTVVCDQRCGPDRGHVYVVVNAGAARVSNPEGSVEAHAGQIVQVASPPTLVAKANVSAAVLQIAAELVIDAGVDPLVPDVPVQPLPPVDLPGSPS
ncbi:hypothetical protein AAG565_01710 [Fontimonas sp. SYSU GA230001]|uniref:hypothetical protein n=1 Tax=Fontimonas sp. SYSU GA230001 TaxID=3142450 RepID=UPI0032B43F15